MRRATRIAVYLCLLLVLNEFGPAHFRRVSNHGHLKKTSKTKSDEALKDDAEKRSFGAVIGKVGKYLLKSLVFGADVLDKLSSIALVIVTFYNLVSQCCDGMYADTCNFTLEATNIGTELDKMSNEINAINLETKNLEAAILTASDDFRHTVLTMHDIGTASARLLQSLDPQAEILLNQTSKNLTKLIQQKNATGEKVDYITVETTYFNVLDGILGIALPLVSTIIPAVPKLNLWIKARMGRYKVYEIEQPLTPPDKSSERYQASKSWFGKKASKITYKVDKLKYKLQTKYEKSFNLAKSVKEGFDAVISLAKTAYSIYFLYKALTTCKEAYDKAKEAVEDMREAKDKMTEVYNGVLQARDAMREARDDLHNQLKSDVFLNDLKELKTTLENLLGEGTDNDFRKIISDIGNYTTKIKNDDPDFLKSAQLISELYQALGHVPEYFHCYSAKTSVARVTLEKCKAGDGPLSAINQFAQELFEGEEEESRSCKEKIGIAPFSDEKLQAMIDENAKDKNFSEVCEANNKINQYSACNKYCLGREADELATSLSVSIEVAEIFIKRCKCETIGEIKNAICGVKDIEIIQSLYPRLTEDQIKDVLAKCP